MGAGEGRSCRLVSMTMPWRDGLLKLNDALWGCSVRVWMGKETCMNTGTGMFFRPCSGVPIFLATE